MSGAGPPDVDLDRVFRAEYGRVVATLIRHFGDIDVAEEAAQEHSSSHSNAGPGQACPPTPADG